MESYTVFQWNVTMFNLEINVAGLELGTSGSNKHTWSVIDPALPEPEKESISFKLVRG